MRSFALACLGLAVFVAACGEERTDNGHTTATGATVTPTPSPVATDAPASSTPAAPATPATPSTVEPPLPVAGSRLTPLGYRVLGTPFNQDYFHDKQLDLDCYAMTLNQGGAACMPALEGMQIYFDDKCTQKGVGFAGPVTATYALVWDDDQNMVGVRIGAGNNATNIYEHNDDGTCTPVEDTYPTFTTYATTDVPLGTFVNGTASLITPGHTLQTATFDDGTVSPLDTEVWMSSEMTQQIQGGDDSLAIDTGVSSDGELVAKSLYDRDHETLCEPVTLADGKLYCLPTQSLRAFAGIFGDAACTTQIYLPFDYWSPYDANQLVILDTPDGSQTGYRISETPVHAGTTYRHDATGACVVLDTLDYWTITALTADADYPAITETPL